MYNDIHPLYIDLTCICSEMNVSHISGWRLPVSQQCTSCWDWTNVSTISMFTDKVLNIVQAILAQCTRQRQGWNYEYKLKSYITSTHHLVTVAKFSQHVSYITDGWCCVFYPSQCWNCIFSDTEEIGCRIWKQNATRLINPLEHNAFSQI